MKSYKTVRNQFQEAYPDENVIKDKVYKTATATLDELRGTTIEEVGNITSDTRKKVFSNLIKRCHACKDSDCGHFQHV